MNDIDQIIFIKNSHPEAFKTFAKKHGVDELSIQDILNQRQRIKIEQFDDYMFAVYKPMVLQNDALHESYVSVLVFKEKVWFIYEDDALEQLFKSEANHPHVFLYEWLDTIVDEALKIYDILNGELIALEENILEEKAMNQELFYKLRKSLFHLKTSVTPIEEHFQKVYLKVEWFKQPLPEREVIDTLDHLKRIEGHIDLSRELMRHLLDLHINNQSNKMNKIMTTLTLFSAIFIPLSFLTGFFGMNFVYFEILAYEHALLLFLLACVTLAVFMIVLFKKLKWF